METICTLHADTSISTLSFKLLSCAECQEPSVWLANGADSTEAVGLIPIQAIHLRAELDLCAGNPNCKVAIVMGKTKNSSASRYKQHSMILVPMDTPGLKLIRPLSVFGYLDEIHGGHFEIHFNDVRVPVSNIILGEGRGFEIAQGRLGPGRIHHCMRSLGAAETALEIMCQRSAQRETFGKKLYQHEVVAHWIAECRLSIEQARLLTLKTARKIDMLGNRKARKEVAMTKVVVPRAVLKVIDCAVQVCGGAGVSQDFPLAFMFAYIRTLRLADGPDEVHLSTIARWELLDQSKKLTAKI
ncbi:acyl-CoA dehydrogenase family member 11 [Pitangus sulphuratus]|nr:acyl-CoA dehydrogenase family member 11 [Pitangus sulphuratus]